MEIFRPKPYIDKLIIIALSFLLLTKGTTGVSLDSLENSLQVSARVVHKETASTEPSNVAVAKAGKDAIEVRWTLYGKHQATNYKTMKAVLCFTVESQEDRSWRKANEEDLAKDKACKESMASGFKWSGKGNVTWAVAKDVPKACYFVRVYVLGPDGDYVAFGQTNALDRIAVDPISGRHVSMDIAAGVFSAMSVVSLLGFFAYEKSRSKVSL